MICRCSGPCNCGCSPPSSTTPGSGTDCVDPGILPRGIPLIADEDFCVRRTRTWRGTDNMGNPITDPNSPAVPGFFVQGSDGLTGFSNQPCVEFPELEAYTYGAFVDSIMGRKDGCEFDVKGKEGVKSILFWDGSKLQFVEPGDIDFGGDCATLGSQIVVDQSLISYTATIVDGMDKLAKNLSVNIATHQFVITDILNQAAGLIKLDLIDPYFGDPVTIPSGEGVCPVGFVPESKLYDVVSPTEMTTGPKLLLQLPNKKFRRMSNPDDSIGVPVLAYDKVTGGLKWVNLVTSPGSTQTVAYTFTGVQQLMTVPAWATRMQFYIWGGAGSTDSYAYGGVGGFVTGFIEVAGGQQYAIVVGGGGPTYHTSTPIYLGGGMMSGDSHQGPGGGLSGIFTGIGTVAGLAADQARAVAIAGGGGAGGSTNINQGTTYGVPGGWDGGGAGFTSTMFGANGTNSQTLGAGAGGGGYLGGASRGRAGWGGKSYLNATGPTTPVVQAGQILVGTAGEPAVPMASSPFYATGVATVQIPPGGRNIAPGGNGLVVLEFS